MKTIIALLASFFILALCQHPDDLEALTDLWDSMAPESKAVINWDFLAPTLCGQLGVTCDANEERVTRLDLEETNLICIIPTTVGKMVQLTYFNLEDNFVSGGLPSQIGNLVLLEDIQLSNNSLTGPIPSEIGKLTLLQRFHIDENGLTDTIPSEIGTLASIFSLHLDNNNLIGPIPTEIGNLGSLLSLRLNDNPWQSTIPTEIGQLSLLQEIYFYESLIEGTIPTEIGLLGNLVEFIAYETNLEGTIPEEIQNMNSLVYLILYSNFLNGTVPSFLGTMPSLYELDLFDNLLDGTIPSELFLGGLGILYLDLNYLTGDIPKEVEFPNFIEVLYLARNSMNCPPRFYVALDDDYPLFAAECDLLCPAGTCDPLNRCFIVDSTENIIGCKNTACVTSVSPSSGVIGDFVTISGDHFSDESLRCYFGSRSTTGIFISPTEVLCQVPSGNSPGNVLLEVISNGESNCDTSFTITSGTGKLDPHFSGFHGEKMEVKRDENAANKLFHLYCSESVVVTSFFHEYPNKLLFMTKFWVRVGETLFTLHLSTVPNVLTEHEPAIYIPDLNRYRIEIQDGHLEWDDDKLRVTYKYLKMNFSSKVYINGDPYMNIEMFVINSDREKQVTGIIGRTLNHILTDKQFEEYLQFQSDLSDIISFSCSSIDPDTI